MRAVTAPDDNKKLAVAEKPRDDSYHLKIFNLSSMTLGSSSLQLSNDNYSQ